MRRYTNAHVCELSLCKRSTEECQSAGDEGLWGSIALRALREERPYDIGYWLAYRVSSNISRRRVAKREKLLTGKLTRRKQRNGSWQKENVLHVLFERKFLNLISIKYLRDTRFSWGNAEKNCWGESTFLKLDENVRCWFWSLNKWGRESDEISPSLRWNRKEQEGNLGRKIVETHKKRNQIF